MFDLILMAPSGDPNNPGSLIGSLLPIILIFVVFYFFFIRPQQKRQKERDTMLSAIKKGDRVIMNGGEHGVIDSLDEKTVVVKLAENVRIKYDRSAISTINNPKEEKEDDKK